MKKMIIGKKIIFLIIVIIVNITNIALCYENGYLPIILFVNKEIKLDDVNKVIKQIEKKTVHSKDLLGEWKSIDIESKYESIKFIDENYCQFSKNGFMTPYKYILDSDSNLLKIGLEVFAYGKAGCNSSIQNIKTYKISLENNILSLMYIDTNEIYIFLRNN